VLILKSALAIVSAVAAVAAPGGGNGSHTPAAHAARHKTCRHVTIQHKHACLAPGRYCTRQWQRVYRHYGYSCSVLDRNDRYHLRRLRHH